MANEYMMVSSVTNVLSQATDWLIDLGENWIDTQLDDGLLKEIPIIKALTLGKNVIRTVTECHEIRQISQFLLMIDTECTDEARRKRYVKVLNENAKQFEKELEYVTIAVTNYLESEKPQMLGRLYLRQRQMCIRDRRCRDTENTPPQTNAVRVQGFVAVDITWLDV